MTEHPLQVTSKTSLVFVCFFGVFLDIVEIGHRRFRFEYKLKIASQESRMLEATHGAGSVK